VNTEAKYSYKILAGATPSVIRLPPVSLIGGTDFLPDNLPLT